MISGVPAHVDGRMIAITEIAGGRIVNRDRMGTTLKGSKTGNPYGLCMGSVSCLVPPPFGLMPREIGFQHQIFQASTHWVPLKPFKKLATITPGLF